MNETAQNREKAHALVEWYLQKACHQDIFLTQKDFETLLYLSLDLEKGKIPAIKFLRGLFLGEPMGWNPSGYKNNRFEDFVKDQKSKPSQIQSTLVGLKEAKDIVDWLVAQKDWLL